jgi:hypothetical protein
LGEQLILNAAFVNMGFINNLMFINSIFILSKEMGFFAPFTNLYFIYTMGESVLS